MKLLKYIKHYLAPTIAGFTFKIAEAALELCVPLVVANIIDVGIKNNDINYIYKCAAILVGLAVFGYAFALVCQWYASKTSQSVGTELRHDMYQKINNYDSANLDKLSAPTLVTRLINDVVQIQLAIAMTIRLTSRAPFIMIGSLVLSFSISGRLASIFIIGAVVLAISMLVITIVSMPYFNRIQKLLDEIALIVRENLKGSRVIRAFSTQEKESKRFKTTTLKQKDIQVKVGRIQALLNPFTYLIVNIAIILIIYSGGYQVNSGYLTQGEIIALVNYMNSILQALIVFANVLSIYNKAGASYQRIFEVLETNPTIKDTGTIDNWKDNQSVIRYENVNFGYHHKPLLNNINLDIQRGQTIGVIGGTGAGKTTLVNLIDRFYDIDDGILYIDNRPIKDFKISTLRKNIGYVMQNTNLFSGTIRDNLLLGSSASDEQLYQALDIAQAREFVEALPDKLDSYLVQGGKNLSGGQKQRLTIARALVRQPKILILDDCSSALDFATDAALRKELDKLDMTKLIISQRTASIKQANKIIVLYHGEVVGYDSHQNLMDNCDIYREIYLSQNKEGTING